jgi:hypothetical protein
MLRIQFAVKAKPNCWMKQPVHPISELDSRAAAQRDNRTFARTAAMISKIGY